MKMNGTVPIGQGRNLDEVMQRVVAELSVQTLVRQGQGPVTRSERFKVNGHGDGAYVAVMGKGNTLEVEIGGGNIASMRIKDESGVLPLYDSVMKYVQRAAENPPERKA